MRIGSAVDNHNYFVIRASCDDLYLAILNAYDTGLPDCQWGPLRTASQWYTDVKPPRVHIFDTRTGAFRSAWCVDLEMARRLMGSYGGSLVLMDGIRDRVVGFYEPVREPNRTTCWARILQDEDRE